MTDQTIHPITVLRAGIEDQPAARPRWTPSFSDPGCRAQHQSIDHLTVSCPRPATLLCRETYLPGSSAQVDGRDQAVAARAPRRGRYATR